MKLECTTAESKNAGSILAEGIIPFTNFSLCVFLNWSIKDKLLLLD